MKLGSIIAICIGAAALLTASLLPFITKTSRGEPGPVVDYGIPPLDTVRPAVTETATFALG